MFTWGQLLAFGMVLLGAIVGAPPVRKEEISQPDDLSDNFAPLSTAQRFSTALRLSLNRFREWLVLDSSLSKRLGAFVGLTAALLLSACGRRHKALWLLGKLHSSAPGPLFTRLIEATVRRWIGVKDSIGRTACDLYIDRLSPTPFTAKYFQDPRKLLGPHVLVLKSPAENEKGVILINYSYAFPLFLKHFDVRAAARRYYLVLETTWRGFCDLDILCYSTLNVPVFVESGEPRDSQFLEHLGSNLISLPVAGNWWVDHRILKPLPDVSKDADVAMIACWADYKRHSRVFAALRSLRQSGTRLKLILMGYPAGGRTRDDVCRQARYYGVGDQVEFHERLSSEQVNHQLNRCKVNLLWSRREGFNRAIIEGMFAGVPCIIREGFNYGYHYPYTNAQTGRFATEKNLPETLLWMVENYRSFSPRDWVMEHMSCERGTELMGEAIRKVALEAGETWTRELALKVSHLDRVCYWNEADEAAFQADYAFLSSLVRTERGGSPV